MCYEEFYSNYKDGEEEEEEKNYQWLLCYLLLFFSRMNKKERKISRNFPVKNEWAYINICVRIFFKENQTE